MNAIKFKVLFLFLILLNLPANSENKISTELVKGKTYFEFKGLDIYKRVLAVVYFDDINVNDSMKTFGGCIAY